MNDPQLMPQAARDRDYSAQTMRILTDEYDALYHLDLDTRHFVNYSAASRFGASPDRYEKYPEWADMFCAFVKACVYEGDKLRMLTYADTENIRKELYGKKRLSVMYRNKFGSELLWTEMVIIKSAAENEAPTDVVVGFLQKNDDTLKHYVDSQLYKDYIALYVIDLVADSYSVVKQIHANRVFPHYSQLMRAFSKIVAPEHRDFWWSMSDPQTLAAFLGNDDKKEFLYKEKTDEDGGTHWFRAEFLVMDRENGKPLSVVLAFLSLDNESSSKEDLNQTIAEQQRALEEALYLAQSANRAKTTFLNNMSHDIRTPMNAIIGFTGLALEHLGDNEQVRNYLLKIEQSSTHLLSLINDVLDMSRIEAGKISLNEKPEDLHDILVSLKDIVLADVNNKGQRFSVNADGITQNLVICDRLRLNQVLLNIVSNAVKYTNPGGSISVTGRQLPSPVAGRNRYEFRISDNGIGMSREFQKTLFEPFTRESTATVSGIEGTGLGMAITKNIVDMMDGTISVQSEKGVGSEFTLILDLAPAESAKEITEVRDYIFRNRRILLVEDNEMNREIASELLTESGFTVEESIDGFYAVETMKHAEPGYYDLILMDIQMPLVDGYEATRQIRHLPAGKDIPIIAMTANAFDEDRRMALEAGMNEHIAKPINVGLLKKTLAGFLT